MDRGGLDMFLPPPLNAACHNSLNLRLGTCLVLCAPLHGELPLPAIFHVVPASRAILRPGPHLAIEDVAVCLRKTRYSGLEEFTQDWTLGVVLKRPLDNRAEWRIVY